MVHDISNLTPKDIRKGLGVITALFGRSFFKSNSLPETEENRIMGDLNEKRISLKEAQKKLRQFKNEHS